MGYYINKVGDQFLPAKGKARVLLDNGAKEISGNNFVENMICVVSNGLFDAAAYIFSIDELQAFNQHGDFRPKVYLTHPDAPTLAGYRR